MITSPLGLTKHLAEPDRQFSTVPFLDACLIGLFFVLNSSQLVFSPGMEINLAQIDSRSLESLPTTAILTVKNSNMLLFEGHILNFSSLEQPLTEYVRKHHARDTVLLLKVHKNVDAQKLLQICDLVRRAGFSGVHLAAEEQRSKRGFAPWRQE